MKKTIRGFTLIECIVALAILGVASLTLAQIYANVAKRNRDNHLVNTSLSNQMEHVEKYTKSDVVPIYYGGADAADPEISASGTHMPPHNSTSVSSNANYVTIERVTYDASAGTYTKVADEIYSFPVDIYVLKSRDANGKSSSDAAYTGATEDNYNLRYKYFEGHIQT